MAVWGRSTDLYRVKTRKCLLRNPAVFAWFSSVEKYVRTPSSRNWRQLLKVRAVNAVSKCGTMNPYAMLVLFIQKCSFLSA